MLQSLYCQESLVKVEEEEKYVANPINSLALVKRLSVELDKERQAFTFIILKDTHSYGGGPDQRGFIYKEWNREFWWSSRRQL